MLLALLKYRIKNNMKATKFFRLKAEWEKAKQPVVVEAKPEPITQPIQETITPVVEEVKQEEPTPVVKTTKKKVTDA